MAHVSRRRPFTIGTLSFARCEPDMLLRPGECTRLILAARYTYAPDLLVTAGCALRNRKQLHHLAREAIDDPRDCTIVTEVQQDGRRKREPSRSHAMWTVAGDGGLQRLSRQAFATAREAAAASQTRIDRFCRSLPHRTLAVGPYRAFALACGEINILRGRDHLRFLDEEVGAAMMAADLVINPTHDRMGRAGLLDTKRRYLSQPHPDGRPRAYVSCSNWELCGYDVAQRPSPTLHAVYLSGEPQPYEELADGAFGFVYRRWRLDLAGSG